jgi:phenylpropionate dioxygenase-like ring-hydroxylating dioxygenase large terminal subunit
LDEDAAGLDEFLGNSLDSLAPVLDNQELEVIHYSEQVLNANWKNWQETNMDFYHEYLHVVNRRTSLGQEGYHERKWHPHANGHANIDPMKVDYTRMKGWDARKDVAFKGLEPGEFRHTCLFPDIVFLCRATILRIDVQVPISATKTLIQFRGLGVKGETAEDRLQRVRDHNEFWGLFGRNLPEDMVVSVAQGEAMSEQTGGYTLFAREDDATTMDDIAARKWYEHWSRLTGVDAANPYQ